MKPWEAEEVFMMTIRPAACDDGLEITICDLKLAWLSPGETRSKIIIETEKSITAEGVRDSSTRIARAGSTVIAGAGQGHTRGQTSLLMFNSYINQSVVALCADPRYVSDLFLFFDLERRYEQFRQVSDGHSSRGSLTGKLLGGLKTVIPPLEVIHHFERFASPLLRSTAQYLEQSQTLAGLRDFLIPKLITGDLRFKQSNLYAGSTTK